MILLSSFDKQPQEVLNENLAESFHMDMVDILTESANIQQLMYESDMKEISGVSEEILTEGFKDIFTKMKAGLDKILEKIFKFIQDVLAKFRKTKSTKILTLAEEVENYHFNDWDSTANYAKFFNYDFNIAKKVYDALDVHNFMSALAHTIRDFTEYTPRRQFMNRLEKFQELPAKQKVKDIILTRMAAEDIEDEEHTIQNAIVGKVIYVTNPKDFYKKYNSEIIKAVNEAEVLFKRYADVAKEIREMSNRISNLTLSVKQNLGEFELSLKIMSLLNGYTHLIYTNIGTLWFAIDIIETRGRNMCKKIEAMATSKTNAK